MSPERNAKPSIFVGTDADESAATLSSDGKLLSYVSDETGRPEVYVKPFPGPGERIAISADGGVEPRWSQDGHELYYRNGDRMMVVKVLRSVPFEAARPAVLFEGQFEMKGYGGASANYDVARDGRFIMVRQKNPVRPTTIRIVLNWPEALATNPQSLIPNP
jgi:serine/threonine-protein kinase